MTQCPTTTSSGTSSLSTVVLQPGDGYTYPFSGSQVQVHFTGTIAANGRQFDSSYSRGLPYSFTLGRNTVIQGWEQTIPRMSLGQRVRVTVPSYLAYGNSQQGVIPPNSDLIYDLYLYSIDGKIASSNIANVGLVAGRR